MERAPPAMRAARLQPYLETGPPSEEGDVDPTSHSEVVSHSKISQNSSAAMDTLPATNTNILPVCGTSGRFGAVCASTLKGTYYTTRSKKDCERMSGEAMDRRKVWEPSVYYSLGRESFHFAGHDISIRESMDTYGALIWPGAVALCQFLENNQQQVSLMDKAVLEIGAGTGLLSIVASLLGAWVTATDLPDILSNLTFNLTRNTRGRARYTPQVAALTWGQHLDRDFPRNGCRYDYILAADVVYHHECLEELLATIRHFCHPGSTTTLLWANKIRFQSDLWFIEHLKSSYNTKMICESPQQEVKIYQATAKE